METFLGILLPILVLVMVSVVSVFAYKMYKKRKVSDTTKPEKSKPDKGDEGGGIAALLVTILGWICVLVFIAMYFPNFWEWLWVKERGLFLAAHVIVLVSWFVLEYGNKTGGRAMTTLLWLLFSVAIVWEIAETFSSGTVPPPAPVASAHASAKAAGAFRLVAPVGSYSEERVISLGSYYIAPLVGQEGCVRFMINDISSEKTCPGERLNVNYKSEKNETVRIRIHSEEPRPITFEFIPVQRSA